MNTTRPYRRSPASLRRAHLAEVGAAFAELAEASFSRHDNADVVAHVVGEMLRYALENNGFGHVLPPDTSVEAARETAAANAAVDRVNDFDFLGSCDFDAADDDARSVVEIALRAVGPACGHGDPATI